MPPPMQKKCISNKQQEKGHKISEASIQAPASNAGAPLCALDGKSPRQQRAHQESNTRMLQHPSDANTPRRQAPKVAASRSSNAPCKAPCFTRNPALRAFESALRCRHSPDSCFGKGPQRLHAPPLHIRRDALQQRRSERAPGLAGPVAGVLRPVCLLLFAHHALPATRPAPAAPAHHQPPQPRDHGLCSSKETQASDHIAACGKPLKRRRCACQPNDIRQMRWHRPPLTHERLPRERHWQAHPTSTALASHNGKQSSHAPAPRRTGAHYTTAATRRAC
jgi:hypothetical protein